MDIQQIKDELQKLEDRLYYYNSKIVSMRFLGLNISPSKKDIDFLNIFLAEQIKDIRKLRENIE